MAGIISTTGLITGIPIEETVNKLMEIAARPRDLIQSRNELLQAEQLAISKLSSLVLAFRYEANKLGQASLYQTKAVSSSDSDVLTASILSEGDPPAGSYKFRVLQTASSQQMLSNAFTSLDDFTAEGTLSFGFGGFVDTGVALADLNGGEGVAKGFIKITDRAGKTAKIDLRTAETIDDVLRAINENTEVDVTATTEGDQIQLTDHTGGSQNLRVQEVSTGTTAASLGLSGINVAANTATGSDIYSLTGSTKLSSLNDGLGVELHSDSRLSFSLADGSTLEVDLSDAETVEDVLTTLNAASPTKLSAALAADGLRFELTDLTSGSDPFEVASAGTGDLAADLGLDTAAVGDTLTGRRLIGGLRDTLVSSLLGGSGLGTLGEISITNRNNVDSVVDLSDAETLGDIVAAINDQATGIEASINTARNGILLTDTTGAALSNLIIADADATNTATTLGIVADTSATSQNSGSLDRQQIGRATMLSSLNQGKGIDLGDFKITDSDGNTGYIDLNAVGDEAETIGDVLDRINASTAIQVEARINDTGDGIVIIDRADGDQELTVAEVGNGTTAADLHIKGTSVEQTVNDELVHAIDGSYRYTIDLEDLEDEGSSILLSSLNGGEGIQLGAFKITDSAGNSAAVVLNKTAGTFETVADVIDAINATDIEIEAQIDSSGTGILLIDKAGGSGTLTVEELAGGTTAADLGLDGTVQTIVIDDTERQTIDGIGTFTQPSDQGALGALASRINALGAGVTATSVYDGTGYRLSLTVDETGSGPGLLVDGLDAALEFSESAASHDAVIEFGGTQLGSGLAVASSTNTFENVVNGLSVTAVQTSLNTISVDVETSTDDVLEVAKDFVDAFNSLRSNLDEVTEFDEEALTTGILFGSTAALRVESDLNYVLSGNFYGLGTYSSLEALGITFDDKGKLSLNKSELSAALSSDPSAVSNFFARDTIGFAAKVTAAADQLADSDSLLSAQATSLTDKIETNTERISSMDEMLDRQRERLLLQFAMLETTVAKLQESLSALNSLQIIPPLTVSRSRNR
ncbi:MAG: flagellar filament capping protein FliD [Pirellulales bacterium]|nr:flagellar filament capping protein FliD [Pirellulales bacterium]